jgi:hypothetical protein
MEQLARALGSLERALLAHPSRPQQRIANRQSRTLDVELDDLDAVRVLLRAWPHGWLRLKRG